MNSRHPRLLGLTATLALAGFLAGVPAFLIHLWTRIPLIRHWTWQRLLQPDDGTLAITVIYAAAWLAWSLLALLVVLEAVTLLTRRPTLHVPGLGAPQHAIRTLLTTATLLVLAVPPLAQPVPASAAPTHTTTPTGRAAAASADAGRAPTATIAPDARTHVVAAGESLWSIADIQLGDPHRYPEIVTLNRHLLTRGPDFLQPGWRLTLPAADPTPAEKTDQQTYTVRPGDTLSTIADRHLGDPELWPAIAQASAGIPQADGRRLTNPDLIYPGWTLHIPHGHSGTRAVEPSPATVPDNRHAPTPDLAPADVTPPSASARPASPPDRAGPRESTPERTDARPDAADDQTRDAVVVGPWVIAGLAGGGAILAAALASRLAWRRRLQAQHRRPGRTIHTPPPELARVERSVAHFGSPTQPHLDRLDSTLRRLAAHHQSRGERVPDLVAVELGTDRLVVHLADDQQLATLWQATDTGGWAMPAQTPPDQVGPLPDDGLAPWPLLVTLGATDQGTVWLINLEHHHALAATGDPSHAGDYLRHLAAEIATLPWAGDVHLDCVGIAGEVAPMNPARITIHGQPAADRHTDLARELLNLNPSGTPLPDLRTDPDNDHTWPAHVLVHTGDPDPHLPALLRIQIDHPGQTGTGIITLTDEPDPDHTRLDFTPDGRVQLQLDGQLFDLTAVGLTPDEAAGCAELLAHADILDDDPVPASARDDGPHPYLDAAGALQPAHTQPRHHAPEDTLLPAADEDYLIAGATTVEDLDQLAPVVAEDTRQAIRDADPTLDQDLADWHDPASPRPKLTLLGPVTLTARGKPDGTTSRRAFYTELTAYLALHPHGATRDQIADALNVTTNAVRKHTTLLRAWLSTDPTTGANYLPVATQSPTGRATGQPIYQLHGHLTDADLFLRLRARAQAHCADGRDDLIRALDLVHGEPFTHARDKGFEWLFEGQRHDQHLICAIVDVAHLVTTRALHEGDHATAQHANAKALQAAPHEHTPQLDHQAITRAAGQTGDAPPPLRVIIGADDHAPTDPPARTIHITRGTTRSDRAKPGKRTG